MKLSIPQNELQKGLGRIQSIVEKRSTMPILANVLIEPSSTGVALTATDMEVGLRTTVQANVKKKGSVTLNARKLYEIVREMTADEVVLRSAQAGWVEILAGRSRFRIVSLDPKDYPELPLSTPAPTEATIKVAPQMLRDMIDKTLFAVSSDETRLNLSGVYLVGGEAGVLRMVATDGHRLAMIERKVEGLKLERSVILPRKGLVEARRLLDEAQNDTELGLAVTAKDARIVAGNVSFFMRLVDGEFPDYRQVVPKSTRVQVTVARDDLFAALRRTSLLASERSRGVKLTVERGKLEISASNPDQGEASEEIEAAYTGDTLSIGFNARYLMDVLGAHAQGDNIELGLTDEVGPGMLKGSQDPSYTYVVMPMRL
jgi:DNA polymerase-3 subunit beta